VYLNCLGSLTKKDQEIGLLKDRIFDLQYVSPCDRIYSTLTGLPRNQLIQTLTSTSSTVPLLKSSGPNPDPTTSSLNLSLLRQSDYPKVKHWVRKRGDNSQVSVIRVVDADSTLDDDENLGGDDPNQEDGVLAFLEDDNGKLISYDDKKQLYRAMRGFWNDRIDGCNPPLNWSSAGETLRNAFRDFLESKFFYLRLCAGRWKVEEIWKRNYHSWLRSFARRTAITSSRQQKRKLMEETTSNARISQTKKAKTKARAISVDSDNPDAADNTDQVMGTNATDGLFGELNEVYHFSLALIDRIRCLVDEAKRRHSRCKSSKHVYYVQITQPHAASTLSVLFQIQRLSLRRYAISTV